MKGVVFITGSSRGIGAAVVNKFAAEGWKVVGFSRQNRPMDSENIKYHLVDVMNYHEVEMVMREAVADFGRVDCLVNCAGIFGFKTLDQYDKETIDKVIGTNELGTYHCVKAILPILKEGSIINIASVAGQVGSGSDPIYAGTKGAVLAFTKSMAKALAPKVRVNAVSPGIVDTDMGADRSWEDVTYLLENTLLKKMALPEDVANGIYFLASDQATHITGACLDINGGYVLR